MSSIKPTTKDLYVVLFIIAMLSVGGFFAYHAPGAVPNELQTYFNLSPSQYGILYTVYSVPPTVMLLVGGAMIDAWGVMYSSIIFNVCCVVGNVVYTLAPAGNGFVYMATGRFIFGIGSEPLWCAAQTMCGLWFHGSWLNFSYGVCQAMGQIAGAALSFLILPHMGLKMGLCFSLGMCVLSLLFNFIYVIFERRHVEFLALPRHHGAEEMGSASVFRVVVSYPLEYWLISAIMMCHAPILYTFTAFGPMFFQDKYDMTTVEAGVATSFLYVSILAAPVLGHAVDRVGRRIIWHTVAMLVLPTVFVLFRFSSVGPTPLMLLMGLCFAVTETNGYAMISVVIPAANLGTANALSCMGTNIMLFVQPYVVGRLLQETGSFNGGLDLFIVVATAGAGLCLLLLAALAARPKYREWLLGPAPSSTKEGRRHSFTEEGEAVGPLLVVLGGGRGGSLALEVDDDDDDEMGSGTTSTGTGTAHDVAKRREGERKPLLGGSHTAAV